MTTEENQRQIHTGGASYTNVSGEIAQWLRKCKPSEEPPGSQHQQTPLITLAPGESTLWPLQAPALTGAHILSLTLKMF